MVSRYCAVVSLFEICVNVPLHSNDGYSMFAPSSRIFNTIDQPGLDQAIGVELSTAIQLRADEVIE